MTDKLYSTSKLAQQYDDGITWHVERQYKQMLERIKQLKPGARRLLLTVHRLLVIKKLRPVNRNEIAQALQHTKLHYHDLKLIDRLIAAGWIDASRAALPKDDDNMPRGFEYRYSMSDDTAWLLTLARSKEKPVFKPETQPEPKAASNLPKRFEPKAAANLPDRAQPDKRTSMQKYLETREPWYERIYDRVLSLFGL